MSMWRVRVEGELLVLQVHEPGESCSPYYSERKGTWRDAKVQDIPVFDPFTPPKECQERHLPDPSAFDR